MKRLAVLLFLGFVLPTSALAQFQISAYGGANTANDSDVVLDQDAGSTSFDIDWFGESFERPPYWGVRGTYWLGAWGRPEWGVAIDFTHAKVEADLDDDADVDATFERLEFTNGLNTLMLNGMYRREFTDRVSAYAGLGAGAAFPHVEVTTRAIASDTFEYQLTGPAVQALGGGNVELGLGFSVFGEYKANYSWNDADLDGGGALETDILTHQFALGLSYSFGDRQP